MRVVGGDEGHLRAKAGELADGIQVENQIVIQA